MTTQEIQDKFEELCNTPSDINEHLPILREYADKCEHITEMGVRGVVSTYAFLSSKAKRVVAIDILNVAVPDVEKLQFICADDLQIEIEPTDFLFIDTAHNYRQCIQELNLHGKNVRKYIGFHDTQIFGEHGDDGDKGLMFAVNEYIEQNKEWTILYKTDVNNGLTIIGR
jgi:hypothetical protein